MPSTIIIGIHGLDNKAPEHQLETWWMESIAEGLGRNLSLGVAAPPFDLVYWAGLMYPAPLDPDPEPYVRAAGTGPLPSHPDSIRSRVKDSGKGALGGVIDKGTGLPGLSAVVDEVVERKTPDLHRYYEDPEKRRQVRQKLVRALEAAHRDDRRIMLIAHSMGSIVAFDVLSAIGREIAGFRVHHFVTVGSPLGLHEVKKKSREELGSLRVPDVVERWTNFADRKDRVAIDTRLSTDYGSNDRGVGVEDCLVINGYVSPSGEPNHHKIYGYLRTPEISELIHEFVG